MNYNNDKMLVQIKNDSYPLVAKVEPLTVKTVKTYKILVQKSMWCIFCNVETQRVS